MSSLSVYSVITNISIHRDMQDKAYSFRLTHLSSDDQASVNACAQRGSTPKSIAESVYQSFEHEIATRLLQGIQLLDADAAGLDAWMSGPAKGDDCSPGFAYMPDIHHDWLQAACDNMAEIV